MFSKLYKLGRMIEWNHCNLDQWLLLVYHLGPVKRICVFEHSVMTNFNCAYPAIQRGQGSGFLSEGSSWLNACMSEQRRFCRYQRYQICLTLSILCVPLWFRNLLDVVVVGLRNWKCKIVKWYLLFSHNLYVCYPGDTSIATSYTICQCCETIFTTRSEAIRQQTKCWQVHTGEFK